jgi:hypothetical protein
VEEQIRRVKCTRLPGCQLRISTKNVRVPEGKLAPGQAFSIRGTKRVFGEQNLVEPDRAVPDNEPRGNEEQQGDDQQR